MAVLDWRWILLGASDNKALDRLRRAGPSERKALLASFRADAADSDPGRLNRLAVGQSIAGLTDLALQTLERLVEEHPADTAGWLNLAAAQLSSGQFEAVGRSLESAVAHASEPSLRGLAEDRLVEYTRSQGQAALGRELLERQAAALYERIEHGVAQQGDRVKLIRILITLVNTVGSAITADQVLEAARDAHAEAPDDPAALELLVAGLLSAGENSELQNALLQLEQRAPHSRLLELVRSRRADPSYQRTLDAWAERGNRLVPRAWRGDPVAETELCEWVRRYPKNQNYRVGLMMAARAREDWQEARRIADGLAKENTVEHETHLHIAQFYAHANDQRRARRHFALAWETARDDEDRAIVIQAMRVVGVRL
ncbi:hypothetical protein GCM10022254_41260 [Actinomadura meridiana]|uniref:Tetratricopeptide repeat protein n=1 Tax=Actinomadura meridiana TaxID=559626 RepID=A0ABP8C7F2_9ACTN